MAKISFMLCNSTLPRLLFSTRPWPPLLNPPFQPPPPPALKTAKKSQQNQRTNWRTDFSAKQAPSALDLSPRPQTHLPYRCLIVAVMWKRKISLNFQKKNFVSRSVNGPWAIIQQCTVWPSGVCSATHFCWCGFTSHCLWTGFFLHFFSLVFLRKLVLRAQIKPAGRRCAALICNCLSVCTWSLS